jgi:hypothetical protein
VKYNPGWPSEVAKAIPKKLRRYEVANLSYEVAALYFAIKYAQAAGNTLFPFIIIAFVIALGFLCVLWACKQ